ncbi:hypothetical protein KEM56_004877 [Ascosphaera pollenicola]|nr:hypothetical protein KEM56_004877 [Ascosphaera pollenicola]
MLVELISSAKEILEKICSEEEKEKDKQAGVKVEWKDEIRDAFSRTLVTVLNRHWIVRMRQFVGFTEARELLLSEGDVAPLDLLYTLMKHDLESFYCAKLVKAQSANENLKLAMTCAMYLMIAGQRLWEYYILNGRESDWTEKDPGARVTTTTTTTTDRQAAREMGKAHWHNWMSAMYSISQDEDAGFLVRGAAVQAVSKMGHLVTRLMQHQELERMEEEGEGEGEAGAETETDIEAALATKLKIHN